MQRSQLHFTEPLQSYGRSRNAETRDRRGAPDYDHTLLYGFIKRQIAQVKFLLELDCFLDATRTRTGISLTRAEALKVDITFDHHGLGRASNSHFVQQATSAPYRRCGSYPVVKEHCEPGRFL